MVRFNSRPPFRHADNVHQIQSGYDRDTMTATHLPKLTQPMTSSPYDRERMTARLPRSDDTPTHSIQLQPAPRMTSSPYDRESMTAHLPRTGSDDTPTHSIGLQPPPEVSRTTPMMQLRPMQHNSIPLSTVSVVAPIDADANCDVDVAFYSGQKRGSNQKIPFTTSDIRWPGLSHQLV